MDPNIGNKGSSPKNRSSKEFHIWSPRNKNLPHISATIDASTKHQLDLANTSPSGGGSTRGGRAYKVAPVRLIPLSLEGRGKENLVGNTKIPNFNKGFDSSNKFEPSHLTIIVHNRPNSEECPKPNASDKINQKLMYKPHTNWIERTLKMPNPSSPASISDNDLNNASTKSKFKSKLLTARVTEEDIAKQMKRSKNVEGVYKEQTISEHSINLNLKKSGMSLYGERPLLKNSDTWQGSKTLDGPIEKSILLADNYKDSPVIESTLLNSSKSLKSQGSPNKDTPEKIIKQASVEKNIFQQAQADAPEIQHPQPKKLFQKKDAQAAPARVPMLFAKKAGSPAPVNLFKPSTPLLGGQVSVASPDKEVEDSKNNGVTVTKEKEEPFVDPVNSATVKRKISITNKKEYFHGEIRGSTLKWKMGDFIGSGNFGQVYRGMEVESGKIIAVKIIQSSNSANREIVASFESELNILQKLKHKHIVQYLGHETFDNSLHIYLEYMSGGNITNILSKYGALPEKTVKVYAKQILAGLIYLHENKVVHKDIKGANILVDGDGTVKLADFGCSTQFEKTLSNFSFLANSIQGSIPWMAPEVVKETGYGRRSDIWSFGCTILEMATGKLPWSHYEFDNPVAVLMKIATDGELPLIPDNLSEDLKIFLSLCLQRDPTQRPHAQDLIIHPFLTNN